jgi:hypothetical protein
VDSVPILCFSKTLKIKKKRLFFSISPTYPIELEILYIVRTTYLFLHLKLHYKPFLLYVNAHHLTLRYYIYHREDYLDRPPRTVQ